MGRRKLLGGGLLGGGLALAGALGLTRTTVKLQEGEPAPDFRARGDDGREYSLEGLRGKWVVLYFYPKDDTPGCTVEACRFRDAQPRLQERGATVLGVSLDDARSHKAFRDKHKLDFPLLVDDGSLARAYGVPVVAGFARRQTFLIDPQGRLAKVFRDVDPRAHADEVLAHIR